MRAAGWTALDYRECYNLKACIILWPRFTNNLSYGLLVYYFCAFCIKLSFGNFGVVIVILNLRFLQCPQSQEPVYSQALNQNTIDRQGLDPDSQSGRHLDGYGGLCLDDRRRGRCAEENKSGYPSSRQPSCHEWKDLEYGVLA